LPSFTEGKEGNAVRGRTLREKGVRRILQFPFLNPIMGKKKRKKRGKPKGEVS